jgi:hypothetical protein
MSVSAAAPVTISQQQIQAAMLFVVFVIQTVSPAKPPVNKYLKHLKYIHNIFILN